MIVVVVVQVAEVRRWMTLQVDANCLGVVLVAGGVCWGPLPTDHLQVLAMGLVVPVVANRLGSLGTLARSAVLPRPVQRILRLRVVDPKACAKLCGEFSRM